MLGLGHGVTSGPVVVHRLLDGGRAFAVPYTLETDEAIVASLRRSKAGIELVISRPERFAGRRAIAQEAIDDGLPIWIVAPTVEEIEDGVWIARDDGLLMRPDDDPALVHIEWQRNGETAGTGATFRSDPVADGDAEIALVAKASNAAGTRTARIVVAEAVRYTRNRVVFTGSERVGGSLAGTAAAPRVAVLWSGRLDGLRTKSLFYAARRDGSVKPMNLLVFGHSKAQKNNFMLRSVTRGADGSAGDLNTLNGLDDALVPAGRRGVCLVLLEAGHRPSMHVSVDGAPFSSVASYETYPAGRTTHLDYDQVIVGAAGSSTPFTGVLSCLRVWTPSRPIIDVMARPSFVDDLMDIDGTVKPASRQAAYFGTPLIDLSADAAAYARGEANTGTAGPFTVTQGKIEDFVE